MHLAIHNIVNTMAPKLEVCVDNFESVKSAVEGGCERIELCSSLLDGGLTPSVGFLKYIKAQYPKLIVFPMIRPRGGDFCYSNNELNIMLEDIRALKENGANGFVFGCLLPDGSVDIESNRNLLREAFPLPNTFHRAFDMTNDWRKSLEEIIGLGFTRLLTSGHSQKAIDGVDQISELINVAGDRIIIMPGSGVNAENLDTILQKTKAKEFHCSASIMRESTMTYRNEKIYMGHNSSDFSWKISTKDKVNQLIEISNKYNY